MPSLTPLRSRVAAYLERPAAFNDEKESTLWRAARRVDIVLGFLFVLYRAFDQLGSHYVRLWNIFIHVVQGHWWNPYTLSEVVEDLSFLTNFWLIQLLWFTFSFKLSALHWCWKVKIFGASNTLMGGGFLPRTSALTVGVVMFLTGAVLSETFVFPGLGQPWQGAQKPWPRQMTCLAIGVRLEDGVSREYGKAGQPAVEGCFYHGTPFYERSWLARDNSTDAGHFQGGSYADDLCSYMCITWQNYGVDSIVKNLGVLASGAVFVVALTDSLSSYLGWSFVSEDSEPAELIKLLKRSGIGSFGGSCLLCALQLNALAIFRKHLAARVDSNGSQTASYVVSLVLLQSILSVVLIRYWSPYHCKPIIYTEKLWRDGRDVFLCVDASTRIVEEIEIDLYEWIHSTNSMRCLHLINYARRVTEQNVGERVVLLKETTDYIDTLTELDAKHGLVQLNTSKQVTIKKGYEGEVVNVKGDSVRVTFLLDDGTDAVINVPRIHLIEMDSEWANFDQWIFEQIKAMDQTA